MQDFEKIILDKDWKDLENPVYHLAARRHFLDHPQYPNPEFLEWPLEGLCGLPEEANCDFYVYRYEASYKILGTEYVPDIMELMFLILNQQIDFMTICLYYAGYNHYPDLMAKWSAFTFTMRTIEIKQDSFELLKDFEDHFMEDNPKSFKDIPPRLRVFFKEAIPCLRSAIGSWTRVPLREVDEKQAGEVAFGYGDTADFTYLAKEISKDTLDINLKDKVLYQHERPYRAPQWNKYVSGAVAHLYLYGTSLYGR